MCAKKQASGEEWQVYTYDQIGEKIEKTLHLPSTFPSVMFFPFDKEIWIFFEGIKNPSCFTQHRNMQLRPEMEYNMTKAYPNMLCETLCVKKGRTGLGCGH